MIVNKVDIFLQYTSDSAIYCHEYIYHSMQAAGAWLEHYRDYHDAEAQRYLALFNTAFQEEYPMFKDYNFSPAYISGIPCCTVVFEISPRIFPPHKDF